MTPLSYQGFGFTAILVMVAILSVSQLIKYLKERFLNHSKEETIHAKRSTPNI